MKYEEQEMPEILTDQDINALIADDSEVNDAYLDKLEKIMKADKINEEIEIRKLLNEATGPVPIPSNQFGE